ncbi:hypothetical protein FNW52_03725 [Flavobacterium sp. ZT3R18]|uniref:hypothetical protein n=1 Tax=Flavobacterium sp. ZT3R18 TaxID=2594429 RepID=UPI00117A5B6B|nr:hypothetical protein [Flavobacterium sp. ZT3R18]TRX38021.1 hypothetical protein FNW52_03725 [Flavobacterium sp. ZT3R18]
MKKVLCILITFSMLSCKEKSNKPKAKNQRESVLMKNDTSESNIAQSADTIRNDNKIINIGSFDNLPKLKFDTISENEYLKYSTIEVWKKTKVKKIGNYFYLKTQKQNHKLKIYKDYGGVESWNGSEFLGFCSNLDCYAITNNSTSEYSGFGELMLLNNQTDFKYNINSFGDGSVELPIPSKNTEFLIYYYNSPYENKNCDIGILKVSTKSDPQHFLREFASYHSNDFAIEEIKWVGDYIIYLKGSEEIHEEGKLIKMYKYFKTKLE